MENAARRMSTRADATKERTYQVRALERGLSILQGFSSSGDALSLSDIAEQNNLNLSTTFRLVRVLTQMRWLEHDERTDLYRLGIRSFEVGSRFLAQLRVEEVALPFLETLAIETDQTASLGVLDGSDVVYLGIAHGQQEVGIQSRIGVRQPAYCTALGKAMLAELDEVSLEAVMGVGMPRRTENTITAPEVLKYELQEVRRRGYAIDNEERGKGVYCVASCIRNHEQRVAGAVSVSAPIFAVTAEARYSFVQFVTRAALDISERLGYSHNRTDGHEDSSQLLPFPTKP